MILDVPQFDFDLPRPAVPHWDPFGVIYGPCFGGTVQGWVNHLRASQETDRPSCTQGNRGAWFSARFIDDRRTTWSSGGRAGELRTCPQIQAQLQGSDVL